MYCDVHGVYRWLDEAIEILVGEMEKTGRRVIPVAREIPGKGLSSYTADAMVPVAAFYPLDRMYESFPVRVRDKPFLTFMTWKPKGACWVPLFHRRIRRIYTGIYVEPEPEAVLVVEYMPY